MRRKQFFMSGKRKGIGGWCFVVWVSLFFVLFFHISRGASQDLNPPYPRLGIFTFSGGTEACLDILRNFDVIAFPPGNEMARKYKEANPDVIVLATSDCLIDYNRGTTMGAIPEEWYYHDVNGNRFELWQGAHIMNITALCPRVDIGDGFGPKTFVDHSFQYLTQDIDFTHFDGVFHDWWWGGPGSNAANNGDLNGNGVADKDEWGIDSVQALWWNGLIDFHEKEYNITGLDYVVIQIGTTLNIWPHVNGACFEDWPIYNGPWKGWRKGWNDDKLQTKEPRIMFLNGSLSQYHRCYPVEPYKNNYKAVRFASSSCLLMSSFFYVDEGNQIGHHGNVHIYDEFEAKGQLGYPMGKMVPLGGKTLSSTPYADSVWVRFFNNGVSVVNATGLEQSITASELAAIDPVSGSRYFRFFGGQDPDFNNGEEVTDQNPLVLWGDVHLANWPELEVFGDGTMLFRTRKTFVTPIVVDNYENNQTSPGSDPAQYVGGWVFTSDGEKFYAFYTGRNYGPFQPDGFAWSPPGSGENVAAYIPTIGLPGMYEVFEWHGYRGSSPLSFQLASDVPVRITTGSGEDTTVTVDQTKDFGKWNSLGTYLFTKGKGGRVEVSNQADGIVISDAMQFVYRGPSGDYDSEPPSPPTGVRVRKSN